MKFPNDMKGTETFNQTIKAYLDARAAEDELFAVSYAKANKNLEECVNYILNEVQKSGCNGFADDEIFGMAVHYYDEDAIKDVKEVTANVVVNHHVELTEEEKIAARERAIRQYEQSIISEQKRKEEEKQRRITERAKEMENAQLSLF